MRRIAMYLFVALLVPALAAAADPAPERLLREDSWFALQLKGVHVGWMHMVRTPHVDGDRTAISSLQDVFMRVKRYGEEMEVLTSQAVEETPEGMPLSLKVQTAMSREVTVTRGVFEDGLLVLEVGAPGGPVRVEVPWPGDGVLSLGADLRVLRATGLKPGAKTSYSTFSPDLGTVIRETVLVEKGRPGGLLSLKTTQEELPAQFTRTLVEPESWEIQEIEIPSLEMRFVRTTQEEAKDLAEDLPDIGFDTMVRVSRHVPAPGRVDRAVYRIVAPDGLLDGLALEDGARQKVLGPAPEGGIRLEVRRTGLPDTGSEGAPDARYLSSSSWLQTESAEVRKALAKALGAEADTKRSDVERAKRLARWVRREVDEQALDVGFATAAEVARDRRGDCTEHAILLAALLRAAGIPSRVRAGLLYLPDGGDGHPAFGFHLWTQAWIGGWLDMDATLGDREADALHLGLATSDMNDPAGIGPLAVMAPLLNALELEILEVE
jgi:hypothetical protein